MKLIIGLPTLAVLATGQEVKFTMGQGKFGNDYIKNKSHILVL